VIIMNAIASVRRVAILTRSYSGERLIACFIFSGCIQTHTNKMRNTSQASSNWRNLVSPD
jgi:hypothetical protein